jgi:hypothetical protein
MYWMHVRAFTRTSLTPQTTQTSAVPIHHPPTHMFNSHKLATSPIYNESTVSFTHALSTEYKYMHTHYPMTHIVIPPTTSCAIHIVQFCSLLPRRAHGEYTLFSLEVLYHGELKVIHITDISTVSFFFVVDDPCHFHKVIHI